MALGEKREIQKLVKRGLVEAMAAQIASCLDQQLTINCIWTLANICATDIEQRNLLLKHEPLIFEKLEAFVLSPNNCDKLNDVVFFISTMIRHESITTVQFVEIYSKGVDLLGVCLKKFSYFDEANFHEINGTKVLKDTANQNLFEIIKAFCVL